MGEMNVGVRLWVCLGLFVTICLGCSDEIKVVGNGEVIPVVYGVFDVSDSVHTVKVMKSFSGEADANDLMQDPDNLFYVHVSVQLHPVWKNTSYFDFNLSEEPRKDGIFPTLPNPIYALDQVLYSGNWELLINLDNSPDSLKINTYLSNDFRLIYPRKGIKTIYLYDDPMAFTWFPSEAAHSYEVALQLKVLEVMENGYQDTLIFTYSRQVFEEELLWLQDRFQFQFFSDPVLSAWGQAVNRQLEPDYRKPIEVIAKVSTADEILTRYIQQNTNTSDIKKDFAGNIPGGMGFIGSKFTRTFPKLKLSPKAMDSLRLGRFTKGLRFVTNSDW